MIELHAFVSFCRCALSGLDLSQHGTVLANDAAGPSGLKYGRAWNMKDHPLRVCKAL